MLVNAKEVLPLDHRIVYGAVPPEAVTVIEPLELVHVAGIATYVLANVGTARIVAEPLVVQPFASVIT
jgi:hypothetical protein